MIVDLTPTEAVALEQLVTKAAPLPTTPLATARTKLIVAIQGTPRPVTGSSTRPVRALAAIQTTCRVCGR
jgi:hypothetical protein